MRCMISNLWLNKITWHVCKVWHVRWECIHTSHICMIICVWSYDCKSFNSHVFVSGGVSHYHCTGITEEGWLMSLGGQACQHNEGYEASSEFAWEKLRVKAKLSAVVCVHLCVMKLYLWRRGEEERRGPKPVLFLTNPTGSTAAIQ